MTSDEIPEMFELILRRMEWMDLKGIKQWNVTEYDSVYPMEHYEELRRKGELFALVDPLKYSINPFGAKKRQAKYESLPVETRVLYEELDAQRRELEKELRELKAQLKKERSGGSDDNCACNGSGGCY